MKPRYDWVLLDADRTLFDFERSELLSLRETLTHFGLSADEETIALYLKVNGACWAAFDRGELAQNMLGRERFARTLEALKITGPDPEEMNLYYLNGLARHPFLLEGAEELCKLLKPWCKLIIVTNGLTVAQTGRLANSALRPYIDKMYISQQLGCQKPETAYFAQVFADLGIGEAEKRRTVIVGDSLSSDIQGGINAGIDTIWFNSASKKCPKGMQITHTVENLEAVGEIILNS